ncbi:hypothetical protein ABIA70_003535 [Arthrobacter sp. 754]
MTEPARQDALPDYRLQTAEPRLLLQEQGAMQDSRGPTGSEWFSY